MNVKKIVLGSDHGGYSLKIKIIEHLKELGIECEDVGTYSEASCNYPVYADLLCKKIQSGEYELGILVCGTGIGMSMAANKHVGIRAACCSDVFSAQMTRLHNDANVLCLGERTVGPGLACLLVDNFINTDFMGGRHTERVAMVMEFDKK